MSKAEHKQLMIFCGLITLAVALLMYFTITMDNKYRKENLFLYEELRRTQLQLAELKRYISYGEAVGD